MWRSKKMEKEDEEKEEEEDKKVVEEEIPNADRREGTPPLCESSAVSGQARRMLRRRGERA